MKVQTYTQKRIKVGAYLAKAWENRALIKVFAIRDIKVKYAQTFLGLFWAVLQPITGAIIFTFFFTNLFDLKDFGIDIPYFLFSLSGYLCWIYFVYIVGSAGTSLLQEQGLIKKINFPKIILPIEKTLVGLVDFAIGIGLLLILAIFGGYLKFTTFILLIPAVFLITILGLSIAIWLSALTIRYRDFHHFIPYIINFGIWITPVFYPVNIIPQEYEFMLYFNPMVGAVEFFRWAIFGTALPSCWYILSYIVAIIILVSGIRYFTKIENLIADHL